eukprot:TRINITY_DN504_c0_g3_i1.p1 TRINITY_DN504_c0_g3~~TRINITY_DN504_c0_g3_i1.p1  ORF type:complete len:227 (+),score=93.53 TRINITY_DN504_c0_g3_i1:37-681(+)
MPKKFPNENSKAVAARARKNDKAQEEKQQKDKEIEDAKWKDDDKHLNKKLARKEDAEKKRLESLSKKKERDLLAEEEEKSVASVKKGAIKITQAQIQKEKDERDAIARASAKGEKLLPKEKPIEENVNVVIGEEVQARNMSEAISALSLKESADKHPEKRMKAAYEEFEKERLPQLKSEFSNLRLSQLKQMLRKEWMKHPDNPLNQRIKAYNEK